MCTLTVLSPGLELFKIGVWPIATPITQQHTFKTSSVKNRFKLHRQVDIMFFKYIIIFQKDGTNRINILVLIVLSEFLTKTHTVRLKSRTCYLTYRLQFGNDYDHSARNMQRKCDTVFLYIRDVDVKLCLCVRPGNLNSSDSGLHHTISLMYVGARHLGFGIT